MPHQTPVHSLIIAALTGRNRDVGSRNSYGYLSYGCLQPNKVAGISVIKQCQCNRCNELNVAFDRQKNSLPKLIAGFKHKNRIDQSVCLISNNVNPICFFDLSC